MSTSVSDICDWVILIGAVCIAFINIYNFFAKPTSFFKKKRGEEIDKLLEKMLDKKIPAMLNAHDLEIRNRYHADKERYLHDIKGEVLNETQDILQEILDTNIQQTQHIDILMQSTRNILRQRIMTFYHRDKKAKKMFLYDREALDELYRDYKAENGNSYIDRYYQRMCTWTVIDEEDDLYDDEKLQP